MNKPNNVKERTSFHPISEQAMFNDLHRAFEELQIQHAALSRVQLVEAFRQALAAGDFMKYVQQVPPTRLTETEWNGLQPLELTIKHQLEERSTIVYQPFAEAERLRAELAQVQTELAARTQQLREIQDILELKRPYDEDKE